MHQKRDLEIVCLIFTPFWEEIENANQICVSINNRKMSVKNIWSKILVFLKLLQSQKQHVDRWACGWQPLGQSQLF